MNRDHFLCSASSAQWLCWLAQWLCWLCSMALLALLTALLALLTALLALLMALLSGSAGSAQWRCWLCSRLCSIIPTFCRIAYIKLRQLWQETAHNNICFPFLRIDCWFSPPQTHQITGWRSIKHQHCKPTLFVQKTTTTFLQLFWTNFGPQKVTCQPVWWRLLLWHWAHRTGRDPDQLLTANCKMEWQILDRIAQSKSKLLSL